MVRQLIPKIILLTSIPLVVGLGFSSQEAFGSSKPKEEKKDDKAKKESEHKSTEGVEKPKVDNFKITDTYVHQWTKFPSITGKTLFENTTTKVEPVYGIALVAFFISSWCIPCQQFMDDLQAIEKQYSHLSVKFIYIFSHDTFEDAMAFAREYSIGERAIVADQNTLREFHTPKVPSIYVADRNNWLSTRYIDFRLSDLIDLEKTLRRMTAY